MATPSPIESDSTTALEWIVGIGCFGLLSGQAQRSYGLAALARDGKALLGSAAVLGVEECKRVELPVVADPQGDLAFAEGEQHVPFPIARVFYVYDVPSEALRGGHAHIALEQVVFCLCGRLEVSVDDGRRRDAFCLDDPRSGLYLPPMIWQDLADFTPGSVYLVLASARFDEGDYIRDHGDYLAAVGAFATDR